MDLTKFHALDIILLCGSYGSGKTAFSLKYFKETNRNRISRSEIRQSLYEMTHFGTKWSADKFNESDDVLVKHIERKIIEHYIHNKKKILIVNTFLTRKNRKRFIDLAKMEKKKCGAIFVDSSLEECLKRNTAHHKQVPDSLIRTLYNTIEHPQKDEGFEELLIVKHT